MATVVHPVVVQTLDHDSIPPTNRKWKHQVEQNLDKKISFWSC